MRNVGIRGGSTVRDLGSASDMQTFFNCIRLAAPHLRSGDDRQLLTDRLYRRYLRAGELDMASALAEEIREIMSHMPSALTDWPAAGWKLAETRLDISRKTVADVFDRYLISIPELSKNAKSFEKKFGVYRPVMTIISDLPRLHLDQERPLAEYDELEGDPIWLRN